LKIVFLYQGIEGCKESTGNVILESLANGKFEEFKCLSAFASPKGINGLKEAITKSKEHIKRFSIIVGIDQNNTSKEALEALLDWNVGASIYYTSSPITFHPKVYMFEGKDKAQIIVGSSNLTKQGLFQNVEASLKVDFNKPDTDGEQLLQQINGYLEPFFNGTITNLQKLTPELIQQLFESGIIPSEAEKKKRTKQEKTAQKEKQDPTKTDALKALFPTIALQAVPECFKGEKQEVEEKPAETESPKIALVSTKKSTITIVPPTTGTIAIIDPWTAKGKLLWQKEDLPKSDVLQAGRKGTNVTGCLRLVQADNVGDNGKPIDQTTYFRNEIFKNLAWNVIKTTPYEEGAEIKVHLKIDGKDTGIHNLKLRHKPSGEAGQDNYTTSLSWGAIKDEITKSDLTGKTLYLYAPQAGQNEPFYIEIKDKENALAHWFSK
jgi:HKD family nuclease